MLSMSLIWITKMATLENINTSYLSPISPLELSANKDTILKLPTPRIFKRPKYISDKNQTKQRRINK